MIGNGNRTTKNTKETQLGVVLIAVVGLRLPGFQRQKKDSQMKKMVKVALFCCLSTLPIFAADVTGTWTYETRGGVKVWGKQAAGSYHPLLKVLISLKAEGDVLTGTVTFPPGAARPATRQISNGKIDGDNLSFDTVSVVLGTKITTHYVGTVDGDAIHFTVKSGGGVGEGNRFDAHRSAN